jgi:hypothetical protein
MNTTTAQKVKQLLAIKTENYRARGDWRPEVAAQFAVEGILSMYRTQPQYIDQLLDEEIEDAIKAGKQAVAA